jgi:hypothetical protein
MKTAFAVAIILFLCLPAPAPAQGIADFVKTGEGSTGRGRQGFR